MSNTAQIPFSSAPADIGETGPSTDLNAQNMPAGTTGVDNGVAHTISGKPVGPASESKPAFDPSKPVDMPQGSKPAFNPSKPIEKLTSGKPAYDPSKPLDAPVTQPDESWWDPIASMGKRIKNTVLANASTEPGSLGHLLGKIGLKADTDEEIDWAKEIPVPPPASDADAQQQLKQMQAKQSPDVRRDYPLTLDDAKKKIDYDRNQARLEQIAAHQYEQHSEVQILTPERLMTKQQQKENPVLYGALHLVGSLTNEQNTEILMSTQGLGFLGEAAAISPKLGVAATAVASIPRAVSLYFSGTMAIGAGQAIPGLYESKKAYDAAIANGDQAEAARIEWDATVHATEAAASAYMSYASAYHGVTGKAEPIAQKTGEAVRETLQYAAEKGVEATGNAADLAKRASSTVVDAAAKVADVTKTAAKLGA